MVDRDGIASERVVVDNKVRALSVSFSLAAPSRHHRVFYLEWTSFTFERQWKMVIVSTPREKNE